MTQQDTSFTYEVVNGEPIHPDQSIVRRLREVDLSDCEYGCKIYGDTRSKLRVLFHSRTYGCPK